MIDALREAQGGTCARCDEWRGLILDHCHVTNVTRGFLCTGCNTAEGRDLGDWDEYRNNPPARSLGPPRRHIGHGWAAPTWAAYDEALRQDYERPGSRERQRAAAEQMDGLLD